MTAAWRSPTGEDTLDETGGSILLSARYDAARRGVEFLSYVVETARISVSFDGTYRHYAYTCRPPAEACRLPDAAGAGRVEVPDLLAGRARALTKLTLRRPQSARALAAVLPDVREADVPWEAGCAYETGRRMGAWCGEDGRAVRPPDAGESRTPDAGESMMPDPAAYAAERGEIAGLMNQAVPDFRRAAVSVAAGGGGIEAVGFAGTDRNEVLVLEPGGVPRRTADGTVLTPHETERDMLEDALAILDSYPVVLTYGGDGHDFPRLRERAALLGVDGFDRVLRGAASLQNGVHVDLANVFANRSLQMYAFSNAYSRHTLDAVAAALLGSAPAAGNGAADRARRGSATAYRLSSYGNCIVMRLLVYLARLSDAPVDAVSRTTVSVWIRDMLYGGHRRSGTLIPSRTDLGARAAGVESRAAAKGKKYKGGTVLRPEGGIYFDVAVADFASLYPSIMKVKNLSYETVRCPHAECAGNAVPDTGHWVCRKRNGLVASIIGSLRDLRVDYKKMARDPAVSAGRRGEYGVIAQALKVVLNASYGVLGSDFFPLYFLPLADATTAYGRRVLADAAERCAGRGARVLYGDTDSLFLHGADDAFIADLAAVAKAEHGVDLELEERYRYVLFSGRKKNYLGITRGGRAVVKGMAGKKSDTPPFVRHVFADVVSILSTVEDRGGLARAKDAVRERVRRGLDGLRRGKVPVEDLAFACVLSRDPSDYKSSLPQHVRAARMLGSMRKGDVIRYVKTTRGCGVAPVGAGTAPDVRDADAAKYEECLRAVLEQITGPLGLNWKTVDVPRQTELGAFLELPRRR